MVSIHYNFIIPKFLCIEDYKQYEDKVKKLIEEYSDQSNIELHISIQSEESPIHRYTLENNFADDEMRTITNPYEHPVLKWVPSVIGILAVIVSIIVLVTR